MAFGLSVLGLNFLPWTIVAALIFGGACFVVAYLVHARHIENPALDLSLFQLPTFFAAVCGGFIFRLGLGALPFLLPLMLQIGFGMTPFQSGMITFATAFGAMGMKWATAFILRRFGFRNILVVNSIISSAFLGICAAFTATTPVAVMMTLLLVGGFFRSLQFTSINTIAYAEVEPSRVSRATSLVSVAQQLAVSSGVAIGAMSVELTVYFRGGGPLQAADFPPAFIAVTIISALSVLIFFQLKPDAGAEMADRLPTPAETSDQRAG
jgi:MFS family permease